ncbi:MAG TPA: di-heme oxidoredictase family protein [Kofleriaceae bacterium]|nr:di-heme oxidoredictase family protein [Kofleriaceae bacterium]
MKAHQLSKIPLLLPTSLLFAACSSPSASDGTSSNPTDDPIVAVATSEEASGPHVNAITEAPTGFDNLTNGFNPNHLSTTPGAGGTPSALQAAMNGAKDTFSEVEEFGDGIGPVFNNTSCVSCHESPRSQAGTGSQITELRAGHFNGITFTDHPGGSLINDRANDRSIQEHILSGNEVQALRLTLSIAGDGYVEAIDSNTLQAIANAQPAAQRGTLIQVPVLEAGGTVRAARFGWKNQPSSLLSFAADAYLNEMGVTNKLLNTENTSNGTVVQGGPFDGKGDPSATGEDDAGDINEFTFFMRSMKAPPRGPINAQVTAGQSTFNAIGCATCHVGTITTAPAGTVINGGALTVDPAVGDKNIHPFGDFLLHDVGTGDGIVQNGGQGTRNQVRTAPLWGIGARTRFMHDGASLTVSAAVLRHGNQAATARNNFNALSATSQANVLAFIFSL